MKSLKMLAGAAALSAVIAAPLGADAKSSDHRTFDGTVVHVSSGNIKVHGTEGGRSQTLSFLINHGTTMRRMIRNGEYVRVIYDQKLLGARHADAIEPYASPAMKMRT